MNDEDEQRYRDELASVLRTGEAASRRARIRGLSDEALTYIYGLLSDERLIVNVGALPDIENEMRVRGLTGIRHH